MTTTAELIKDLAATTELTQVQVTAVLKALTSKVSDTLAAGEEIRLHGLGTFSVRDRAARAGRNPSTGAALQIPASKGVAFKVAKALKDTVKV